MPPKKSKKSAPIPEEEIKVPIIPKRKEQEHKEETKNDTDQEKIIYRIFVAPEKRRTDNVIRNTELARILSLRAETYTHNQIAFTNITGLTSAEQVAIKELLDKKFPLDLIRDIAKDKQGNIISEIWNVNEMTLESIDIIKEFLQSAPNV